MSKKNILIFGASGILGSALVSELNAASHSVSAPPHSEVDITDLERISAAAKKVKPDVIVNAAGFTAVDRCEKKQKLAFKVNAEAAGILARAAKEAQAVIFQISTDYIFPGDKQGEYLETDAPGPLNIYGKSKLFGEDLVRKESNRYCIIRASWLFGPGNENFITKIIKKSRESNNKLKVVLDEIGRPTYSRDLAYVIRLALERELVGIYHFCNKGAVSWFEYAAELFKLMGKSPKLVPVSAEDYGLPAKRPKNSTLSTEKIEKALGLSIRHHQEAVRDYLSLLGLLAQNSKRKIRGKSRGAGGQE